SLAGCGTDDSEPSSGRASAHGVSNRSQLVGGDRALGEVGDLVLENEKIRVVIQKEGFSRGFGVYGGGLIDADLRRPREDGTSGEANGNDQFAELFPAFFVQAVAVSQVQVLDDGTNGGPARVEASGVAGDFLELVAVLNRAVTGSNADYRDNDSPPRIRYSTIYELEPGKQYVNIRFRVENISDRSLTFPAREANFLFGVLGLPTEGFTVPIGDIALFGATSKVFIPGVGFDLRFGLERAYARGIDFPAFPGFATEFIASRGENTSYGMIVEESDRNYVFNKRSFYEDGRTPITRSSMLVPFVASSFLGVFYQDAPPGLAPGESFELLKHFVIGSGDVGSVLDIINEIRGEETGHLGGQVFDAVSGEPQEGLSVVVYQRLSDGSHRPYSQYDVRENGSFGGSLVPGNYSLKVVGTARPTTGFIDFDIAAGRTTSLRVASTPPGRIFVRILDENGVSLPAKATAVGRYAAEFAGELTPSFLFDLEAGEDFRSTDLITDDANDPSTREYIEGVGFTADGIVELLVRPGEYDVVSSRGPEYDVARSSVRVDAGQTATISHRLRRVVDTRGWVALDSHIHSRASIDSPMGLDERVASLAAEGVEVAVATDHNYITDYAPFVARNGLIEWLHPVVGLEMTTLESGHFNGYPLRYQVGPITHGSFEWARRPPQEIFDGLRNLGSLGAANTIVQVNHPRDDLLGYYTQYSRDPLTHAQIPPTFLDQFISPTGPAFIGPDGKTTFSFDYEAVELLNGKLFYEVHHYRVPEQLPPGELPPVIPPTGSILRDVDGQVAFRGVVDDWFNLLNLGYRYIGVGTGDSHSGFDEAGQFRTMVYVGTDQPMAISDRMIVNGLRSRRAVATNGPLIDFWINDPDVGAMGQTIEDGDGTVELTYKLTSAPWISIERLNIYRNGVIARTIELDPERDLAADPVEEPLELPLAVDGDGAAIDSWFVIEAIGYRSMHPVIRAQEIPPLLLTDALASLAGPLGFGNDEFGDLRPAEVFPVTGYAITNPVWVTTDGGEFTPPGIVPLAILDRIENYSRLQEGIFAESPLARRERIADQRSRIGRVNVPGQRNVPLFYPRSGNFADVRKVMSRLGALGKHGGH
ncbi:MAG TPA: hypothetical protein VEB21_07255, partial [Terriglobales bacterium]|nr:hypothetical protein [Terriglobales bacterium]